MSAEAHARVVAMAADRLRKHRATAAVVGDRVSGPDDPAPASLPCVVVTPGRDLPGPRQSQGNVRVECRAATEAGLHDLLTAVHLAFAGWRDGPVRDVVLMATGEQTDAADHWTRRDVFAVVYSDPKPVTKPVPQPEPAPAE